MPAYKNPLHALGGRTISIIDINKKSLVHVRDKLGRFITNFPKETGKRIEVVGRDYQRGLKRSARINKLRWKNKLIPKIKSRIETKGQSKKITIRMPQYGFALDEMRPHYVPTKKYPMGDWVKETYGKGRSKSQRDTEHPTIFYRGKIVAVYVRPHPWLEQGYQFAREKVGERLNITEIINKAYR